MPVMDGYEATRRIRAWERDNGVARVPIVALTAHAMRGHEQLCLEAGMDRHATKPIDLEKLQQALLPWAHDAAKKRRAS